MGALCVHALRIVLLVAVTAGSVGGFPEEEPERLQARW